MKGRIQWSDKELANLRKKMVATYFSENRENPKSITCDDCMLEVKMSCLFAYDPYNTDGDCLAMK